MIWNNGNPFPTLPESIIEVIDDADPDYMPDEDILGKPRPVGLQHDIGAVESGVGVYLPLACTPLCLDKEQTRTNVL